MSDDLNTNPGWMTARGFYRLAIKVQVAMICVACLLGYWLGTDPWLAFDWSIQSIGVGVLGTLPLLLLMGLLLSVPIQAFEEMREFLIKSIGPMLAETHWFKILVLAILVGLGEELLFRGVLQPWLFTQMVSWNAIILSSVLFAVVHSVSTAYVVTVFFISLYLGYSAIWLGDGTEHNLVPPFIMHTLYDYIAFVVIGRTFKREYAPGNQVEQDSTETSEDNSVED